jgi:lactate dehydrogenase-like 2-hydroxyacid dehydrogenase
LEREAVLTVCASGDVILAGARFLRRPRPRSDASRGVQAIVRFGIGFETIDVDSAAAAAIAKVPHRCIEEVATKRRMLFALNRRLLGAPELGHLRPGATLVDVGRPGLIDEDPRVSALHSGALANARWT